MARKFVLGNRAAGWLSQQMRMGPQSPFTRLTFREVAVNQAEKLIPVDLIATAGSATASPANWRYTIRRAFDDQDLMTDVDPTALPHRYQRPTVGLLKQAKAGFVVVNPDANQPGQPPYVVWDINEVLNASTCPANP